MLQQQAFAVSEVTLKEDPIDDSIVTVLLQLPNQQENNWVSLVSGVFPSPFLSCFWDKGN